MRQYERLIAEGSRQEFLEFAAGFDAPAFVRRAQYTEECEQAILEQCAAKQKALLELPRTRLGALGQLIELQWARLDSYLSKSTPCTPQYLADLHREWQPKLRVPIQPTSAYRRVRRALVEVATSFEFFNQKWHRHIESLDLTHINHVRQDYNNYYVVEKSCAFGSERIGQAGFEPLPSFEPADVWRHFPLLEQPALD